MGKSREPTTELWLPLRPIAKQRVAFTHTKGTYTPKRTARFEEEIAALYDGHLYDHAIGVDLELHDNGLWLRAWPEECDRIGLTGDVDNYAKAVLDGLNGKAWKDDKLIKDLRVWKAVRQ